MSQLKSNLIWILHEECEAPEDVQSLLVKDDLANGRLVRLFPELNLRSPLAYYLVYRPENCQRPSICRFRDWLNGQ